MALSNGNGSFSGPLIFLNARSKDAKGNKVDPHFEIARVGEDKKIHKTEETCTRVSGNLLRPQFKTRPYEGQDVKHVVLYVQDKDKLDGGGAPAPETYSVDLTYRIASRSLFNAILSLTDPENISISIYENKGGYEALSLWQGADADGKNGVLVPWKFDGRKGEIPEAIEGPVFKGRKQFDYTPVDEFFEEQLKSWADMVFGPEKGKSAAAGQGGEKQESPAAAQKPAPTQGKAPAGKPTAAQPPPAEEDDSSVPF